MQEKIKALFQEKELDAILVADGFNMRYISGFTGATGYLYLSKERQVVLTDSRYTLQAQEESEGNGFSVIEISREQGYPEHLARLAAEEKIAALGFEDNAMLYSQVKSLQEKMPVSCWTPIGDSLSRFRQVKTAVEIERMAKAEAIGDAAFAYLCGEMKPGVTELEIAAKLEYFVKTHGAEGISFSSIVASGLHSAMPHATPTRKPLEKGDFVTLDFGCLYEGYCSDMTRTVVIGKASEKQKEIYGIVLEAQLAGLAAVKAGLPCAQVDKAARSIIEKAGYGAYFGHGLGHNVGLEIHESPALSPKDETILAAGMIETVEPGIYIPGFGGVRIEDMVVVTEDGCRNLTCSPKELIEL